MLHKATNSRTPPIEPALKQEKQLQKSVQKRKENSLLICRVNFTFDFGTNHAIKFGLISESFPLLLKSKKQSAKKLA